ncbi:hypothetical protein HanPSC8_Chr05g0228161 [Helianthus annuus]|nr:hypothetical protein HanPSC8_Chr05g0228161 [Helianthus annuus]
MGLMSDVVGFRFTVSSCKALYLETLSSLNGIFLQITQTPEHINYSNPKVTL